MALANPKVKRQVWLLVVAWAIIGIDQAIKNFVISSLSEGVPQPFIGDLVKLNLLFNDSAAFSIGGGATWIFTIISTLAALALLYYSRKIQTLGWAILAGVLLGGVVGNLIDRLTRAPGFPMGHVVDYIQIPFNFPVFNIADMAIFFSVSIAVIRIARGDSLGRAKTNG